jgi:hypothetical protein
MREGPDPYFFLARQAKQTLVSFVQECRWIAIYLMSPIAFTMKFYEVFDGYKYLIISGISFFPVYALVLYRVFCYKQIWARLILLSFFGICTGIAPVDVELGNEALPALSR